MRKYSSTNTTLSEYFSNRGQVNRYFEGAYESDVIPIEWGKISITPDLKEHTGQLLDNLNVLFKARLTKDDYSIALGHINQNTPHGKWISSVKKEDLKRDIDEREIPIRLIIPINGDLICTVNTFQQIVKSFEIQSIRNNQPYDYFTLEESGVDFLIIDIPPFVQHIEEPVKEFLL